VAVLPRRPGDLPALAGRRLLAGDGQVGAEGGQGLGEGVDVGADGDGGPGAAVEDDPTVAAVIAGLLGASGHEVRHAENALSALSELASAIYDVVLIDLDLPGVDGLALARMIRARASAGARQRLIGISARSAGDEETQCLAAGMDAFVRKPVAAAVLADCLSEAEDRR